MKILWFSVGHALCLIDRCLSKVPCRLFMDSFTADTCMSKVLDLPCVPVFGRQIHVCPRSWIFPAFLCFTADTCMSNVLDLPCVPVFGRQIHVRYRYIPVQIPMPSVCGLFLTVKFKPRFPCHPPVHRLCFSFLCTVSLAPSLLKYYWKEIILNGRIKMMVSRVLSCLCMLIG